MCSDGCVCWQVRDEELDELDQLLSNYCELPAAGGVENSYGKINVLLQTYISRGEVDSFSLISDLSYVAQVRNKEQHTKTHTYTHTCKLLDKPIMNTTVKGQYFWILQ